VTETIQHVPIAQPVLGNEEVEAVSRAILSGWVTQGPEVAAFEREFAEYVDATHAVALSNCTTALHLALLVAGVGGGDEVITVSHSFIATANAIRYCGATPVFVDVHPTTFNMNPSLVEPAITAKTKAILCVHQLGMPCDMAAIAEIGRRQRIPVIEDAACAIGSEIQWQGRWQRIGNPIGDIACFSFHPRKVITTGDGGMLTTNNPEYDKKVRLWRQHSMSVPDTVRHNARDVIFESYPEVGFNYRLTDLQAAVGREQLKRLPGIIATRRRLATAYLEKLACIPGLQLPVEPAWARSNWQSFCVVLPVGTDQRAVMQHMLDCGLATRRGVMCIHREKAYAGSLAPRTLPASEQCQDRGVILPLHTRIDEQIIDRIVTELGHAIRRARVPEPRTDDHP
jgi:dTDP-4-amino-4,6-dideoxygalactose transaminase